AVAGALATGVAVLGWEPALTADTEGVGAAHAWVTGSDVARRIAEATTVLGSGWMSFVVLAAALAWLLLRRRPGAGYVAFAGAGAVFADAGLKLLVDRARPVVDGPVPLAVGTSFPSGHATNAAITFGVLLLVLLPHVRRDRWAMTGGVVTLVVAAVGLSRVGLGVHHPADVVAGWALGVLWLGTSNW